MEYNELVFLDQSQHKYLDIVFSMYPASLLFLFRAFLPFPLPLLFLRLTRRALLDW